MGKKLIKHIRVFNTACHYYIPLLETSQKKGL